MGDQAHRKLPPDRPSDVLASGSNKKKKNADTVQDAGDQTLMEEVPQEVVSMIHEEDSATEVKKTDKVSSMSYKASLLGFNGIAHGGEGMDEEELLSDTINKEWELPEPSEEVMNLMKIHPVVPITPEEYSDWCRPWNAALILTVLGKRYNIYTLKTHLSRLWNTPEFDLVDLPNNYFIVRFLPKEGWGQLYQKILYGGPWVVQQHTILIQKWSPSFDPFHNPLGKIATWVRVPNIPMQCYNKEFLTRLGNCIGRTLKIDMLTPSDQSTMAARIERGRYARICVELDLQKKLVSKVIAAHSIYHVEYEGLNLICFACGRYGHRQELCQWTYTDTNSTGVGQMQKEKMVVTPPVEVAAPSGDEVFGAWMIAGRFQRTKNPRRKFQYSASSPPERQHRAAPETREERSTSRFNVLVDLAEDDEAMEQHTLSQDSPNKVTGQAEAGGEMRLQGVSLGRQSHINDGGSQSWQSKQGKWARVIRPDEAEGDSRLVHAAGTPKLGQNKPNKKNGLAGKKGLAENSSMARRQHVVVGGNLAQLNSSPIGMGTNERRQHNNTVLMLEGPVSKETRPEDPFIKEKCEQSYISTSKNGVLLDPNNITLEEDMGDDFMMVKDGELGHPSLEQRDQRGETSSGMQ